MTKELWERAEALDRGIDEVRDARWDAEFPQGHADRDARKPKRTAKRKPRGHCDSGANPS